MKAARVTIQTEDFDLGAEVAALRAGDAGIGAVASFVGTLRDRNDGLGVRRMELEHYPGMTERSIEAMVDAAFERFDMRAARVVHRVGPLEVGDQIVLVVVGSRSPLLNLEQALERLPTGTTPPFSDTEVVSTSDALDRMLAADFDLVRFDPRRRFVRARRNVEGVLTAVVGAEYPIGNPPSRAIACGELVRFLPFAELRS